MRMLIGMRLPIRLRLGMRWPHVAHTGSGRGTTSMRPVLWSLTVSLVTILFGLVTATRVVGVAHWCVWGGPV